MVPARVAAIRRLGLEAEYDALTRRIQEGRAGYADVQRLAGLIGRQSGAEMAKLLRGDDREALLALIRQRLPAGLRENHELVAGLSAEVQQSLNQRAGIGLKAVRPAYNASRAEGLLTELEGAEDLSAKAPALAQQAENAARAVVDDTVKANAAFHWSAGLRPRVTRVAVGKCCEWCQNLAGTYRYPDDIPEDLYRRHTNCNCLVLYDPGNGAKQDVHSKRAVADPSERIREIEGLAAQRRTAAAKRREELYERMRQR